VIETERLRLRRPLPEDAGKPALAEMYADPEVMAFIGGVSDPVDMEFVVGRWLERWDANGFGPLVVERRDDGEPIGRTGLLVWDTRDWHVATLDEAGACGQPELGWALARAHWGQGYATEAARAVRHWARSGLGIGRLISVIAPANARSIRVAEKLGAVPGERVELYDASQAVVWEHPR
jgi:RimJ/RimL family protein N-acetyltransferase